MAEKFEDISELVIAYITKQLSEDQERTLNAWVEESPANKEWLQQWDDISWIAHELEEYNEPDVDEALSEFYTLIEQKGIGARKTPASKPKPRLLWKYIAAAAAVTGLLIGAWKYDLYTSKPSPSITTTDNNKKSVDSINGEHITLALTDRANLMIDDLPNGVICSQAGVEVIKQDSVLQYKRVSQYAAALDVIHTISTGKGKRLRVILLDNSSVWLNAASSIRIPLAYKTERKMEMTGEVYIEVYKDKLHPFILTADRMKVEVLGTKFNVNTYDPAKTVALLEGRIKIRNGKAESILSVPGETALVGNNSKIEIDRAKDEKDIEKISAWRTGAFNFRKDHITDALREIERWYGVEVKYINIPPTVISNSSFLRSTTLPEAIRLISKVDSNLTIFKQDNVLIVSYKK
ncbi:FecR family protein [Niastella sp. OAS944]|uniref:FecR family protein n=1 Tax=Niastella sp. OAS944 TaxID=2664089 RepID=UPI003495E616|nr:hypothetical protein [Chitinophagaceae bacterium OAS944]